MLMMPPALVSVPSTEIISVLVIPPEPVLLRVPVVVVTEMVALPPLLVIAFSFARVP